MGFAAGGSCAPHLSQLQTPPPEMYIDSPFCRGDKWTLRQTPGCRVYPIRKGAKFLRPAALGDPHDVTIGAKRAI